MNKSWALLVVLCISLVVGAAGCSTEKPELIGFAATGEGTTGGAGGETVTVSSLPELLQYIQAEEPYIIQISGAIDLEQRVHQVGSNKTIIGLGSDAKLLKGALQLTGVRNVIIRNITFSGSGGDAVDIQEKSEYV